jgi:hypothetical protein
MKNRRGCKSKMGKMSPDKNKEQIFLNLAVI